MMVADESEKQGDSNQIQQGFADHHWLRCRTRTASLIKLAFKKGLLAHPNSLSGGSRFLFSSILQALYSGRWFYFREKLSLASPRIQPLH